MNSIFLQNNEFKANFHKAILFDTGSKSLGDNRVPWEIVRDIISKWIFLSSEIQFFIWIVFTVYSSNGTHKIEKCKLDRLF